MDLSGSTMREGVIAQASGRVLVVDDTVWFERPGARTLVKITPPRPPAKGRYAVRAHGVDLDRLDRRRQYAGGIVEGWTALTGTWRQHELHVLSQTAIPRSAGRPKWTTPPCPPPTAGWPTAATSGSMPAANLSAQRPGPDEYEKLTITQVTQFHPTATQPVLVVAAEDPTRVEQALRRRFGAALCVVPSRYRWHEIEESHERLTSEMASHRWRLTSAGRSAGNDGQATVTAQFAWIEPEVAEWAATVPEGLLDPQVWLTPVRTDQAR
jgi:hypothetical protein